MEEWAESYTPSQDLDTKEEEIVFAPPPKKTIMVLEGYPLGFSLDRLRDHPLIESASRLIARSSKETRQVHVTILGDPIKELNLGIFGTFSLREH